MLAVCRICEIRRNERFRFHSIRLFLKTLKEPICLSVISPTEPSDTIVPSAMKPWPQLRHFTSSTLPARGLPTVSHEYARTLKQLNLMEDPSQAAVAQHLDAILRATERPLWVQQLRRGIFPGGRHHGLYLHGSVGTGMEYLCTKMGGSCFGRAHLVG